MTMVQTSPKAFSTIDFFDALSAVRGAHPSAAEFATINRPKPWELHAIYARGFRGVRPETQTFEQKKKFGEFMAAMPTLYEAFPWAKDLGKGKVNCPYVGILHFDKEWGGDDAQARGDCTVHGTAHAAAIDYGNDALIGETKYQGRLCCENIYRSRGFNGDGWSCQEPCMYIGPQGKGGLLYRKVWSSGSDSVDLSNYNPDWEGNGRAGVPSWMETESQKNKVKLVIPITTADEYRDTFAMGMGINVCSGQGFSDTTDENGVSRAQGSWSHSMAHTACIDTDWAHSKYGDRIGGIQQSWGKWNTQNGKPQGSPDMPIGMFYSKMNTIMSMIDGQDSFALCGVWGWERSSWEAFITINEYRDKLLTHLKNSTTQDYYKTRAEKIAARTEQAIDEGLFITV